MSEPADWDEGDVYADDDDAEEEMYQRERQDRQSYDDAVDPRGE